jgi:DNA polymerase-3 subunit alpha
VVTLIDECRSMGLKVEPPKLNRSEFRFTIDGDATVVYGLGAIKGVGESAIASMLAARNNGGPFQDLWDFCRRIDLHKVNRRVLEAMVRAGALDDLGENRATLMNQLPLALKLAEQHHEQEAAGQADLFGALAPSTAGAVLPDPQIAAQRWADWDEDERLQGEKETLGLYLTGHPINRYDAELNQMVPQRIGRLLETAAGLSTPGVTPLRGGDRDSRTVVGLVIAMRTNKTARGRMASLTLDDRTGRIEATVFNDLYEQVRDLLVPDALLAVTGTLRPDDFTNGWSLIARSIRPLAAARAELADHLLLRLDLRDPVNHANGHGLARQLLEHLSPYRREEGLPLRLHYLRPGAEGRMRLADGWRVEPSDALLKRLRRMLGDENVEVIYQRELQLRPALPDPAAPPRLVVVR